MQIGYPEAGEFFGIALALFPSPDQMAFQQASSTVGYLDIGMPRPVHRPGSLSGSLQDGVVHDAFSGHQFIAANSRHS